MAIEGAISVVKTGATLAVGAASASVAIPTNSSGAAAKYARIAATSACYVKLGPSGVTAAAGDLMLAPGDAVVLKTSGVGYVAAIQVSAAGTLQVSPLEDQ